MRAMAVFGAAAITLSIAMGARAQTPSPPLWKICSDDNTTPEMRIGACSIIILSEQQPPGKLAVTYYDRGIDYGRKGDHDRAIADFTKAISLDPKNAKAYDNRCFDLAVSGKAQSALADCDAALRLKPDYADAFVNRAFAYYQLTRYDAALADYDAAVKLDPKEASALYGRGMTKLKKGDPSGDADIAEAKAIQADIADEMARYGMK
jgi:tetratricopeptide (TPR) repeat protein